MLDVDLAMGAPGSDIDDGFALALALADPGVQVDLVTTVNGNTDATSATQLTLELLHRLGRTDLPVVRGAQVPLVRPQARVGQVPDDVPRREMRDGAAAAMVELVNAHPGEMTLVAVGPLTNVALAMRLDADFAAKLKRLVIMGGVYRQHTNSADMPGEFNIWCDPEAAHIVLTSGISAWWVGLDVTLQVRLTRAEAEAMEASDKSLMAFAGKYSTAWIDHIAERDSNGVSSCAMHDPLAVAAVTHPDVLQWEDAYVQVELGDRLRGAMVADFLTRRWSPDGTPTSHEANAHIATGVDAQAFTQYFLTRIGEL